MASQRTETFTQTLQDMEQSGDTSKMAALFSDSAELRNLTHQEPEQGQAGARRFWDRYLSVFDQIRSTFTHTIEGDNSSVLEWSFHRHPGGRAAPSSIVASACWSGKGSRFAPFAPTTTPPPL